MPMIKNGQDVSPKMLDCYRKCQIYLMNAIVGMPEKNVRYRMPFLECQKHMLVMNVSHHFLSYQCESHILVLSHLLVS